MIDPQLKKQEEEVKKIIKELIIAKPEVRINDDFVKNLKKELIKKQESKQTIFNFNFMNKLAYAGIGMAVMALILIPFIKNNNTVNNYQQTGANKISISSASDRAFGSLKGALGGDGPVDSNLEESSIGVLGLGAGNGGESTGDLSVSSSRMIMPNPFSYKYVYVGDDFEIASETTKVIKRDLGDGFLADQNNLLRNLDISSMDYSKFDNLKLMHMNLYEDSDYGYVLNINPKEEKISISMNWEKWPRTECDTQACWENSRLKISEVPSDQALIAIADNFLNEYEIDMSAYGEPSVDKRWKINYERADNKDQAYIPETMTVIYPLVLDDKEVYEQHSNKYGLNIQINARENRVSYVSEISSHNYLSSNYEAVEDASTIINVAERGGYGNYVYERGDTEIQEIEVQLASPSLELVRIWKYNNERNSSEELYVEAYVFPVVNNDSDSRFHKEYVVVPLVKELIEEDENRKPEPYIGIPRTPILEDDATGFPEEAPDSGQSNTEEMPSILIEPRR